MNGANINSYQVNALIDLATRLDINVDASVAVNAAVGEGRLVNIKAVVDALIAIAR